jgi:ABC-type uncharacterized transport system substrate-binding protein
MSFHKYMVMFCLVMGSTSAVFAKTWHISAIQLHNEVDLEETSRAILAELRSKLAEGQDFDYKVYDAQGDIATLTGLVDAALARGTDMFVTLSTPALQATLQKARNVPIIYTRLTSGVLAGAGKSVSEHAKTATGVQVVRDFDRMVKIVRDCLPKAKKVGTLIATSEVNMGYNKDLLEAAAKKVGLELVAVPVNTSTDVMEASVALTSLGIDAVCQAPGNLITSAFAGLAQAAKKAHLPIFCFQKAQAVGGAALALAPESAEAGKETARIMLRVIKGESPAAIPIQDFTKEKLFVNTAAAQAAGLTIPPDVLKQAVPVGR